MTDFNFFNEIEERVAHSIKNKKMFPGKFQYMLPTMYPSICPPSLSLS
jgi:hypothetical protein